MELEGKEKKTDLILKKNQYFFFITSFKDFLQWLPVQLTLDPQLKRSYIEGFYNNLPHSQLLEQS